MLMQGNTYLASSSFLAASTCCRSNSSLQIDVICENETSFLPLQVKEYLKTDDAYSQILIKALSFLMHLEEAGERG